MRQAKDSWQIISIIIYTFCIYFWKHVIIIIHHFLPRQDVIPKLVEEFDEDGFLSVRPKNFEKTDSCCNGYTVRKWMLPCWSRGCSWKIKALFPIMITCHFCHVYVLLPLDTVGSLLKGTSMKQHLLWLAWQPWASALIYVHLLYIFIYIYIYMRNPAISDNRITSLNIMVLRGSFCTGRPQIPTFTVHGFLKFSRKTKCVFSSISNVCPCTGSLYP